jgi:hypothetical protein
VIYEVKGVTELLKDKKDKRILMNVHELTREEYWYKSIGVQRVQCVHRMIGIQNP